MPDARIVAYFALLWPAVVVVREYHRLHLVKHNDLFGMTFELQQRPTEEVNHSFALDGSASAM